MALVFAYALHALRYGSVGARAVRGRNGVCALPARALASVCSCVRSGGEAAPWRRAGRVHAPLRKFVCATQRH